MNNYRQNQKLKVRDEHPRHGSKEGYFQFTNNDDSLLVLSTQPVYPHTFSVDYFVVSIEDINNEEN